MNKTVIDYRVVENINKRLLEQDIIKMCRMGFVPKGGIGFNAEKNYYMQAMVIYLQEDE